MSDVLPIQTPPPVPASLPNAKIRFLNPDGTVSLPWWRYFQAVFNRTGGGPDTNAQILEQIAAGVAEAQNVADQALADAEEALNAAEEGPLLAVAALGTIPESEDPADPLILAAMSCLDAQTSSLIVKNQGTQITAAARSMNFTGAGVVASDDGAGNEVIDIAGSSPGGGVLPLVNGDLPIGIITDPSGQTIGVPL